MDKSLQQGWNAWEIREEMAALQVPTLDGLHVADWFIEDLDEDSLAFYDGLGIWMQRRED